MFKYGRKSSPSTSKINKKDTILHTYWKRGSVSSGHRRHNRAVEWARAGSCVHLEEVAGDTELADVLVHVTGQQPVKLTAKLAQIAADKEADILNEE